jgi:hypothetical protein
VHALPRSCMRAPRLCIDPAQRFHGAIQIKVYSTLGRSVDRFKFRPFLLFLLPWKKQKQKLGKCKTAPHAKTQNPLYFPGLSPEFPPQGVCFAQRTGTGAVTSTAEVCSFPPTLWAVPGSTSMGPRRGGLRSGGKFEVAPRPPGNDPRWPRFWTCVRGGVAFF